MRDHIENAVAAVLGSLLIAAPFVYWMLGGPHA
jgi:hypothetical protein